MVIWLSALCKLSHHILNCRAPWIIEFTIGHSLNPYKKGNKRKNEAKRMCCITFYITCSSAMFWETHICAFCLLENTNSFQCNMDRAWLISYLKKPFFGNWSCSKLALLMLILVFMPLKLKYLFLLGFFSIFLYFLIFYSFDDQRV